jgi:hypothetical protein
VDLPDPAAPARYPDNIPGEFAYNDLGTPVSAVQGGGTLRFRDTLQAFGLGPGETPIIRNFARLTLRGVPPGTYGVLDDPQGTFEGTTFVVAEDRAVVELLFTSPNATSLEGVLDGPVQDLGIRAGPLVLARDGVVVADVVADDFVGCADAPPDTAPPAARPQAAFESACGFLRCAFDGRTSFPTAGHALASWDWSFGDGGTGQGPKLVHPFPATGSYVVTLTVRDDTGATSTLSRTVDASSEGDAPPGAGPPRVRFEGVRTNNFLGVLVTPGADVSAVRFTVDGGPLQPMGRVSSDEWRAAAPARNVVVQLHATHPDGTTTSSGRYLWPSWQPA